MLRGMKPVSAYQTGNQIYRVNFNLKAPLINVANVERVKSQLPVPVLTEGIKLSKNDLMLMD